jgi:diadenosine tetraphosphate (Ap4A) HIT family hydrolase
VFVKKFILLSTFYCLFFGTPLLAMLQQPVVKKCTSCLPTDRPDEGQDQFVILQTDKWKLVLSSTQHYLGELLLVSQRHVLYLEDLNAAEDLEYLILQRCVILALKQAFKCKLVNLLHDVNPAFKEEPANPHVHWHFIPRYEDKILFASRVFHDTEWPNGLDLSKDDNSSRDIQPFHRRIMTAVATSLQKVMADNGAIVPHQFISESYFNL